MYTNRVRRAHLITEALMGNPMTTKRQIIRSSSVAFLTGASDKVVVGDADCIRTAQRDRAPIHTTLNSILVQLANFFGVTICIRCASIFRGTASEQILGISKEAILTLAGGSVINCGALRIRTTFYGFTNIDTVKYSSSSDDANLVVSAFFVRLAYVWSTSPIGITSDSCET